MSDQRQFSPEDPEKSAARLIAAQAAAMAREIFANYMAKLNNEATEAEGTGGIQN